MTASLLTRCYQLLTGSAGRTESSPAAYVEAAVEPAPVPQPVPAVPRRRALPQIEMEVVETAEGILVRVRGEGLIMEVDHLQAGLLRLAAQRLTLVTIDLSELRSVSSLAMGVLVGFRRGVVRGGGRVRLLPAKQTAVRE